LFQAKKMNYVDYLALGCSVIAFLMCLITIVRVRNFFIAVKELDWVAIANLTAEQGSIKRTIQSLSNRLNGMNSGSDLEKQMLEQLMKPKDNIRKIKGG